MSTGHRDGPSVMHPEQTTRECLPARFRDCAARLLPSERVESLLGAVRSLEKLPDAGALARLTRADAR